MLDISAEQGRLVTHAFREEMRHIADRAAGLDEDGSFPHEDVARLKAVGALAAPFARSRGGGALGNDELVQGLALLGWASLPLGRLFEGHVNAAELIGRYGTREQRMSAGHDAANGALFGVWNTEVSPGVRLVHANGRLQLVGSKAFASGAGFIDRPLITARDENDRPLMMLPRLDAQPRADLSAWKAHGMRASATGTFCFTGLTVEPEDIIGHAGDYHRQPHFSGGAWRFCAVQLGAMERLIEEARSTLRGHGREGDPHQRARMGEAVIAAETARLWVERAARLAETEDDTSAAAENIVAYVNLARCAVERCGLDVIERVQRSIGLSAFLRAQAIERICRDLATYLRQPAPDRALCEGAGYVLESEGALSELWR
jgi:alkylation response protein AidB-like acyl-CoA dehydrogenase